MQLTVEWSISQSTAPRLHPSVQWSWVKMCISRSHPGGCGEPDLKSVFPRKPDVCLGWWSSEHRLKNTGSVTMTLFCGRGFKGPRRWCSGSTEHGQRRSVLGALILRWLFLAEWYWDGQQLRDPLKDEHQLSWTTTALFPIKMTEHGP